MTNFVSYALVEMMTWQGLGDVINRFRERALGLDPISLIWAPGMLTRLRIPYTYCWSVIPVPFFRFSIYNSINKLIGPLL
jgi:hypothetical protein